MNPTSKLTPAASHDDAAQKITGRQKWHIVAFDETPGANAIAMLFVERLPDGSARLVFEQPETRDDASSRDEERAWAESRRFTANPRRIIETVPLDAATMAAIDRCLAVSNR